MLTKDDVEKLKQIVPEGGKLAVVMQAEGKITAHYLGSGNLQVEGMGLLVCGVKILEEQLVQQIRNPAVPQQAQGLRVKKK